MRPWTQTRASSGQARAEDQAAVVTRASHCSRPLYTRSQLLSGVGKGGSEEDPNGAGGKRSGGRATRQRRRWGGDRHRHALRGQAGSSGAGLQGKAPAEDFRMKEDRKPEVIL